MESHQKIHKPTRRNLLVVCAGDQSLHPAWADCRESFDIVTIYYGNDQAVADRYKSISDIFFMSRGLKIELARNVLLRHMTFECGYDFSRYQHVWFPDDDLEFVGGKGPEDLFEVAAASSADVFQPAVANEYFSSEWQSTRLVAGMYAHRVNIVEIMAHGFSGEAFAKSYLPAVHVCEFMKAGWGLEPVWMRLGEAVLGRPLRSYVFDCVPVNHTRPVGAGDSIVHRLGRYEAQFVPQIHTNRMVTQATYTNLAQLRSDLDPDVFSNQRFVEQWHADAFRHFKG